MTVESLEVALMLVVLANIILGPRLWYLARRLGWREGLTDRDAMFARVYGPNWKERLITHDHVCKAAPSEGKERNG